MSIRTNIILAALIIGFIVLDLIFNGGRAGFFLLLKLAALIEWVTFWR